jgi:hypothetical protein
MIDQANHLSRLSGSRFAAMLSDPSEKGATFDEMPKTASRRVFLQAR